MSLLTTNLRGCQKLDYPHYALATRAMPDRRFGGGGRIWWWRGRQQSSAERQQPTTASIGQKAEVANAGEASRENVFQETAQERFVRQGHRPPLAAMGVVFPEERHVGVGEIDEPMI
jgi:hypothetical protein